MGFRPISLFIPSRNLFRTTAVVEQKLSQLLPKKLAFVFDGWTARTTNYVGLFASIAAENANGSSSRLIGFWPIGDETTADANEHISCFFYVLQLFDRSSDNVVALIGNNCKIKKPVAHKRFMLMTGYASRRFNLADQDILSDQEPLLLKINALKKKLWTPLLAARLAKQTGPATKKKECDELELSFSNDASLQ